MKLKSPHWNTQEPKWRVQVTEHDVIHLLAGFKVKQAVGTNKQQGKENPVGVQLFLLSNLTKKLSKFRR